MYLTQMNMMFYTLFRASVMYLEWIKHAVKNIELNHIT